MFLYKELKIAVGTCSMQKDDMSLAIIHDTQGRYAALGPGKMKNKPGVRQLHNEKQNKKLSHSVVAADNISQLGELFIKINSV